jgi:hypothetical protein
MRPIFWKIEPYFNSLGQYQIFIKRSGLVPMGLGLLIVMVDFRRIEADIPNPMPGG